MPKYLLVSEPTGMTAEELGRRVGMHAVDTPLGTMLEQPEPFDLHGAMAALERSLNPTRCSCGHSAIIHMPPCPFAYGIT